MTEESEGERVEKGSKRAYVKPKIAWEEPFEPVTSAISCAKRPGESAACQAAPKF